MSQTRRVAIVLGTLAIVIAAFLILKPGDDDSSSETTVSLPAATTPAEQPAATTPAPEQRSAPRARPRARPRPRGLEIVVRGGEPVGGVRAIKLRKGETIRFTVRSDVAEEVHLHGYDVSREVAPGTVATFAVPAEIEGIFEVELEHSAVPIAEVTVEP